ncbi:MAG TPA: ferrochelatase [Candidatus Didemnitutus sp.]|nr:ferrochelatase [Candidatus Didemnitutus sp.]
MKQAVMLVNLGSPSSPSEEDVRNYLDEFLHDPNVIDLPWWLRRFIVDGIVLRTRPPRTAALYASIWTNEGSPLIVSGRALRQSIADILDVPVALAMRYGDPSISEALGSLVAAHPNLEHVILVPLYPQSAMATTKTVIDSFATAQQQIAPTLRTSVIKPWYDEPRAMSLLASRLSSMVDAETDAVILSYHGIPKRHLHKMDPTGHHCKADSECCTTASLAHATCYLHQCKVMTDGIAVLLPIQRDRVHMTFQSRFGFDRWLTPSTDDVVVKLAREGAKRVVLMAPAFVADCLETLEELCIGTREKFLHHGGVHFDYVSCLNADSRWVQILASLISCEMDTCRS